MFWQKAPAAKQPVRSTSLDDTLTRVGAWYSVGSFPLPQKIITVLKLDDYINRNFSNGQDRLSLYIGYYNSSKKVGAAHDPMVCFPGQGWALSGIKKGVLVADSDGQKMEIHYSSMIAERSRKKELLLYWFQADEQATPDTLSQKIWLLRSKLAGGGDDNAFVRITMSLEGHTETEARQVIFSFVENFYPVFHAYIKHRSTS